jgi:hypothetical protein
VRHTPAVQRQVRKLLIELGMLAVGQPQAVPAGFGIPGGGGFFSLPDEGIKAGRAGRR